MCVLLSVLLRCGAVSSLLLFIPLKEINGVKVDKSLFMNLHRGIELAALECSLKSEADNGPEEANTLGGLNLRGWGRFCSVPF